MKTLSAEAFKAKYGDDALARFSTTSQNTEPAGPSFGSRISEAFDERQNTAAEAQVSDISPARKVLRTGAEAVGFLANDIPSAAIDSIPEPVKQVAGQEIEFALNLIPKPIRDAAGFTGKILKTEADVALRQYDEFKQKYPEASKDLENIVTISQIIPVERMLSLVGRGVSGVTSRAGGEAVNAISSAGGKVGEVVRSATDDLIPSPTQIIDENVKNAFGFAPSDFTNIKNSTGNDIGSWLSENKLIGKNAQETKAGLEEFYTTNYKQVREQIRSADDVRKAIPATEVPRYSQALDELASQTRDIPGLEREYEEILSLSKRETPTLGDIQRVKELLDEHFNLYKTTGDVKEGIEKQGLANMRREIRQYLETEVRTATGADIAKLNNNVSTSRAINIAIEKRAPKGYSPFNLKQDDLTAGLLGFTFGGPLGGAALLFLKKIAQSPTMRLRIARYMGGVSEAQKAKIKADLEAGVVPNELETNAQGLRPGN